MSANTLIFLEIVYLNSCLLKKNIRYLRNIVDTEEYIGKYGSSAKYFVINCHWSVNLATPLI